MGTVAYMSPEQARGETLDLRIRSVFAGRGALRNGHRSDPFAGSTSALIFDGILHGEAAPATRLNSKLPLAMENIFAKALEKDTDLRYQTAAELRADLKRLKRDMDANRRARKGATRRAPTPARWGRRAEIGCRTLL